MFVVQSTFFGKTVITQTKKLLMQSAEQKCLVYDAELCIKFSSFQLKAISNQPSTTTVIVTTVGSKGRKTEGKKKFLLPPSLLVWSSLLLLLASTNFPLVTVVRLQIGLQLEVEFQLAVQHQHQFQIQLLAFFVSRWARRWSSSRPRRILVTRSFFKWTSLTSIEHNHLLPVLV